MESQTSPLCSASKTGTIRIGSSGIPYILVDKDSRNIPNSVSNNLLESLHWINCL